MKLYCNSCDGIYDSLDVRITRKCDNNCNFCIEKQGIDVQEKDVSLLIQSTKQSNIKNILILGGEPCLNLNRLYTYIIGIRHFVDTIYITTSLPISIINNMPLFDQIMSNIDGLNVSLHHYNWQINNSILNSKSKHNRINILQQLLIKWNDKIRVCINLTKSGINSKYDLTTYINNMKALGVKSIKINELQNNKDRIISDFNYVKYDEYVSYEKILDIKLPSAYSSGCQTDCKIFSDDKCKVIIKRSCFLTAPLKYSIIDFIKVLYKILFKTKRNNKFAVLYENGELSGGWKYVN